MSATGPLRWAPPGSPLRRWGSAAAVAGWCLFLAYSAFQSAVLFLAGLGEAPAYGDTKEYWGSADTLRVDDVRTWVYPALLRFAPGDTRSTESIAAVQILQLGVALAAAAFFGWVLARLLGLPGRWRALAVTSCLVLSGASLISVHMSHSILQDSLAASGWLVMLGATLMLFLPGRLRLVPWLAAALPAAVLVAGLRWERLYVALPLLALTAAILALTPHPAGPGAPRRLRLTLTGALAVAMLGISWVARSTLNVEGRELPESGAVASRLLDAPFVVTKTFLESVVSPISSVVATNTADVVRGLGAVGWTNSRLLEHVGYWPSFLWLSSALLVAAAFLIGLILGLPALLGRSRGNWPAWLITACSIAAVAALHAVTYRWFHPRYSLPITGIELALAALLPIVLLRSWLSGNDVPAAAEQDPVEERKGAPGGGAIALDRFAGSRYPAAQPVRRGVRPSPTLDADPPLAAR